MPILIGLDGLLTGALVTLLVIAVIIYVIKGGKQGPPENRE